ncbi:MAG TPA: stage 0 sporulation family protein [Candidatus Eisenbacteria bacterium]|nr:stage 0 sporulation family protein [Candidatus Eisenbacteria bacterium]
MHEHESDPVIEDVASTPPPPQSTAGNGKGNGAAEAIPADVIELVFKGRRRAYYANPREIPLREGDYVIVQAERGEDLGRVHHTAEWVRRPELYGNLRHVLRSARPEDLETLDRNRTKEERAFQICKDRVVQRDIEMKVVDCEYQLDGNRITFYFTAEKRVDFRDLVKDLAAAFRTRIELRQIGVRDEAGRIGGVGTCGRELCCSTWLRQFEPITLKMAKDQGLSPSPSKISGACGRLKCCLRYELDFYKDVAREFPKVGSKLTLMDGEWEVGRVDIFRREIHLVTDDGKESMIALDAIPAGTKVMGPSRDRRKGCDKEGCASRGAKPGDGESGPPDRGARGGDRGGQGDRRPQRPGGDRRGRPGGDRQGGDRGGDRGHGGDRPPRGDAPGERG